MANKISVPDYVLAILGDIAKSNGFNHFHLEWTTGAQVGDGFTGQILKVTITSDESADPAENRREPLILVVKLPPDQKDYRKMSMLMFARETTMYNKVLPSLHAFQLKHNLETADCFAAFPKCHLAYFDQELDEAVIVLDDLRENGFQMESKYEVIGLEHAKMVVQMIARYHATSTALKHLEPEVFAPFRELDDLFKSLFDDNMLKGMTAVNVTKTLQTLRKDGDDIYREKLEWYKENVVEILSSIWDAEPLAVPIHGDCWSNNFMFKYVNGHPKHLMLLDWQLSRYLSPIIDFCHFMFVCTDSEFRKLHYESLIELYYSTVQSHLKLLGCEASQLFPYDTFRDHFKKFGKFILFIAMLAIPIISTPNEDLPDMGKLHEELQGNLDDTSAFINSFKSENNKNYVHRMSGAVRDLVDYGYL